MLDVQESLKEFTNMHNQFINDWSNAMLTGDTSLVDRMTSDYYVAFFNSAQEKPIFFSKQDAISGMEQSVKHYLGAQKRFENRVIRLRNSKNAVVFYEQLIVKNEEIFARLFTIENWMRMNEKWMIVRETEERIS